MKYFRNRIVRRANHPQTNYTYHSQSASHFKGCLPLLVYPDSIKLRRIKTLSVHHNICWHIIETNCPRIFNVLLSWVTSEATVVEPDPGGN